MLVEDDEDIRLMMRLLLEQRGYGIVEAGDGAEAVEMAWRECPDIILLDLTLPVMDGLTAARRIREDPQMRGTVIVAVTAHAEPQYRENALAAGVDAFVTKPIDIAWLAELLEDLLVAR